MVMLSKIPPKIREELSQDPYMLRCINEDSLCKGRIEWHHAFKYAGKRVNELWSILPLCAWHHYHESAIGFRIFDELRSRIKHFQDLDEFHYKYPKSNLFPKPPEKKRGRPVKVQ